MNRLRYQRMQMAQTDGVRWACESVHSDNYASTIHMRTLLLNKKRAPVSSR